MTQIPPRGRDRDAKRIRQANCAAAVGRLMLGEIRSWQEFITSGGVDSDLPRRNLRFGARDVRQRLKGEIAGFIGKNFLGMTSAVLASLWDEILAHRGLEIPLGEFEARFARINPKVLAGTPRHATIVISLWGLSFMYPEDFLAKDVREALQDIATIEAVLERYRRSRHAEFSEQRDELAQQVARISYSQRNCLHACFSLLESNLNGLAWEAAEQLDDLELNPSDAAYIMHCSEKTLASKVKHVPLILGGSVLWPEHDGQIEALLSSMKPVRDSLTHPSPFKAPEKFGGYDKLAQFYRVDSNLALETADLVQRFLTSTYQHVKTGENTSPRWLSELGLVIEETKRALTNSRQTI